MTTATATPRPRLLKFDSKAEWLVARRKLITASEVPKILGMSPFGGPLSVWADKMAPQQDADGRSHGPKRRGLRMEGGLLDEYADAHGVTLLRPNSAEPWLVVHPTLDWLAATPDAIIVDDDGRWIGVVEAKTANFRSAEEWGEDGTGDVPGGYATQVAVQLACCDVPSGAIVASIRHMDDIRFYPMARRWDIEPELVARLADWRERHLIRGERPALDGSDDGDRALRFQFPRETSPDIIRADAEAEQALVDLCFTRGLLDDATAAESKAAQRVKDIIGASAGIEGAAARVTWKASKDRTTIDWQAVAADLSRELGEHVGVPEAQRIAQERVATNTHTKPGSRTLLVRPRS